LNEKELIILFKGTDNAWLTCSLIAKKMKGTRKTGSRGAELFSYSIRMLMGSGGLDWSIGEKLLLGDLGRTILAVGRISRTKKTLMKVWLL